MDAAGNSNRLNYFSLPFLGLVESRLIFVINLLNQTNSQEVGSVVKGTESGMRQTRVLILALPPYESQQVNLLHT